MQRLDLKRGEQLHITELAGGGISGFRPMIRAFREDHGNRRRSSWTSIADTLAALAKRAQMSEPNEPLWIT